MKSGLIDGVFGLLVSIIWQGHADIFHGHQCLWTKFKRVLHMWKYGKGPAANPTATAGPAHRRDHGAC